MSSSPISSLATLFAPVCPAFDPSAAAASVFQTLINYAIPAVLPLFVFVLGCLVFTDTATTTAPKAATTVKAASTDKPASCEAVIEAVTEVVLEVVTEESIHPDAIPTNNIQSKSLSFPKSPSLIPESPENHPAIASESHALIPIVKPFEYYLRRDLPDEELAELNYSEKARRHYLLTNPPEPKVTDGPIKSAAPQSVFKPSVEPVIDPHGRQLELPKRDNALLHPEKDFNLPRQDNSLCDYLSEPLQTYKKGLQLSKQDYALLPPHDKEFKQLKEDDLPYEQDHSSIRLSIEPDSPADGPLVQARKSSPELDLQLINLLPRLLGYTAKPLEYPTEPPEHLTVPAEHTCTCSRPCDDQDCDQSEEKRVNPPGLVSKRNHQFLRFNEAESAIVDNYHHPNNWNLNLHWILNPDELNNRAEIENEDVALKRIVGAKPPKKVRTPQSGLLSLSFLVNEIINC